MPMITQFIISFLALTGAVRWVCTVNGFNPAAETELGSTSESGIGSGTESECDPTTAMNCLAEKPSLRKAFDAYENSCDCKHSYDRRNCAHYLSNALIKGGFAEIDGGNGGNLRIENGYYVCRSGRPVRAKQLRAWFQKKWRCHAKPRVGINVLYQENDNGQGHVLLKEYTEEMVNKYCRNPRVLTNGENVAGTGDYGEWPTQEFYYDLIAAD